MSGAHTNHENDWTNENIDAEDIPVYSLPELPSDAYVPFVVSEDDPDCAGKFLSLYHLPFSRLSAGGGLQTNTYSVAGNGYSAPVPAGQVIPAYTSSSGARPITPASAQSATTLADYLVLAKDGNITNNYIIQNGGFYTFPSAHGYIAGVQYYLSDTNGQVGTTPGLNSQKVFRVIDNRTISVNIR